MSNNGRPFFSRNIGLVQGRPVSLIVGDKLSGQFGGFDIGAFSVLTDETPTGEGGQILSVARVTHPIFAESKFGFVVTNGDPTGLTENTVAGVDFQYRNSNLSRRQGRAGRRLLHEELLEHEPAMTNSAAFALNFPNEPWLGDLLIKQIGANFTPALGFVNRTAIRQYVGTVAHRSRYRNTYLNTLEFGTDFEFVTDLNDVLESRANDVYVRARSRIGDQVTRHRHQFVRERAGAVSGRQHRSDASWQVRVEQFQRKHAHVQRTALHAQRQCDVLQLL